MSAAQQTEAPPRPLTVLSEDEKFFQSTVRKFAREQIRPYVREMDEASVFRMDIIRQFFDLGLMGIEIPEEYGGQDNGTRRSWRWRKSRGRSSAASSSMSRTPSAHADPLATRAKAKYLPKLWRTQSRHTRSRGWIRLRRLRHGDPRRGCGDHF
jgi:alkylation response protein AidB-like acyl-CoA dehydrogenase